MSGTVALSDEKRARAYWAAWRTASRLRSGAPRWVDRLQGSDEPGTIRVDLGWSFAAGEAAAVAHCFVERLRAEMHTDAGQLDGRLFVVDDARWWVLHDDGLVEAETAAGERRSVGGIVLAVGAHAGQTLDAVAVSLDAALPDSIDGVFAAMHPPANSYEAKALAWACEELGAKPADVTKLCLQADLGGLASKKASEAWWEIVREIASSKGRTVSAQPPGGRGKGVVVAAAGGVTAKTGGQASKPTGAALVDDYSKWIHTLPQPEAKDEGLREIFGRFTGKARKTLGEARREANKLHRAKEEWDEDFNLLAPMPLLGPKDRAKQGAPGVPLLDAVWALRQLRGAFPGLVAATPGAALRVTRVVLRVTPPASGEVLLYPVANVDLRGFGRTLAKRFEPDHPTKAVYQVVIDLCAADGTVVEVPLEFAWRWKDGPSRGKAWGEVWKRDQRRFEEVASALKDIVSSHDVRRNALVSAHDAMMRLQLRWTACAETLDERAGLHVASEHAAECREFLGAYEAAAGELAGLFEKVGPLAPRVANGPLEKFLGFGLAVDGNAGWLFGHHPVRLRRQYTLERWALDDIVRELASLSTVQDIPVVSTPEVDGAPSVLWSASMKEGVSSLLVSSTQQDTDPWCEKFHREADMAETPPDLIGPLRPVFAMFAHLWPGLVRRLDVVLDDEDGVDGDRFRPLALCADLSPASEREVALTAGVDLHLAGAVAELSAPESDEPQLARVRAALSTVRADDPRPALALHTIDAAATDGLRHHVALLVRPSHREIKRTTRGTGDLSESDVAMAWDEDASAWSRPQVSNAREAALERTFQRLVVLRKRGDEDNLPRCFVETLDAERVHASVDRNTQRAARLMVVDRVYGAEALDARPLQIGVDQRVTYADFDRKTGWRITIVARHALDAETAAVERGLAATFPGGAAGDLHQLADRVTAATRRAVPAALRGLVHAGSDRYKALDGELIGHVGVALLVSRMSELSCWADQPDAGTLLLSMDNLQRWTWTRRSGTRGDFLALTPLVGGGVRVTAIESKGSEGRDSANDGSAQANAAREKLRERFGGIDRTRERAELLRCVAEEAFRACGSPRGVYDRIADGRELTYEAISVETSAVGSGLTMLVGGKVPRVRVGGIQGLLVLAGIS